MSLSSREYVYDSNERFDDIIRVLNCIFIRAKRSDSFEQEFKTWAKKDIKKISQEELLISFLNLANDKRYIT